MALAGAVAVTVSACAGGTAPRGPATAALPPGCYSLSLGAWSKTPEASPPPGELRLLDSLGTDGMERNQKLVRNLNPDSTTRYWMWWDHRLADSLRLVFSTGFVGVVVDVERHETTWDGRASAFTDMVVVGVPEPRASATLAPRACP